LLGFVIPIKPKAVSRDWNYDLCLLERTVRSICGQTSSQFKIIIVFNERPEINFSHSNIMYAHYPFPTAKVDEIEDFDSYVVKHYNKEYAEKMMDKGKKIFYGCKIAKENGCDYIMAVDSDDLVSNKLALFVEQNANSGTAGWRINRGYIYEEGSFFVIKSNNIFGINGSTHIIKSDIISIPDFNKNIFWNFNLFEAHGYTLQRLKDFHQKELTNIFIFGIIYIVHKNNYSNIKGLTSMMSFKNIMRKIIRGKLLSKGICQEFGLYKIIQKI